MRASLWFLALAMGSPGTFIPVPTIQNEKPVSSAQEAAITKEFSDRIKAYVALQKKLEGSLPGLKTSNDSGEIAAHAVALREKIIEARSNLQQGNIFSGEIAAHFKSTIRKTFQEPGSQVVRRTIQEGDPPKPIVVRVNSVYPDSSPVVTTPPTLLSRLPELPMELTYRILGHTFVLLDSKTNVIVDFIPDAIP
jgi:hypothetical protein